MERGSRRHLTSPNLKFEQYTLRESPSPMLLSCGGSCIRLRGNRADGKKREGGSIARYPTNVNLVKISPNLRGCRPTNSMEDLIRMEYKMWEMTHFKKIVTLLTVSGVSRLSGTSFGGLVGNSRRSLMAGSSTGACLKTASTSFIV